jgi:hypothetical protein
MADLTVTATRPPGRPILKPGTKAHGEIFSAQQYALEANRRAEAIGSVLDILERAAEADGHVTAETVRRLMFLLDEQTNALAAANYRIADAFELLLGPAEESTAPGAMH